MSSYSSEPGETFITTSTNRREQSNSMWLPKTKSNMPYNFTLLFWDALSWNPANMLRGNQEVKNRSYIGVLAHSPGPYQRPGINHQTQEWASLQMITAQGNELPPFLQQPHLIPLVNRQAVSTKRALSKLQIHKQNKWLIGLKPLSLECFVTQQ